MREIHGVDGAEHDAEPPDQRIVPVRPPAPARRRRRPSSPAAAPAPARASAMTATGTLQNTKPHCQLPRPAAAPAASSARPAGFRRPAGRWCRPRWRSRCAAAARRAPPAAGHLHDGDAGAHHDRHRVEPGHVGHAPRNAPPSGGERKPDDQRRAHAEPRDQQRAGHRGEGEQHRRQAGEDADLGFRQAESSWISGMTGGTARMVRRSALPASQSSVSAVSIRARDAPPDPLSWGEFAAPRSRPRLR